MSLMEEIRVSGEGGNEMNGDCGYASLQTPPRSAPLSGVGFAPRSNWTVLSSLQHSVILGEQKSKMPLMIRVRFARVLAGVAAGVTVLMILVGVFASGVPIASRDTEASVAVLNEYNFVTGTIAGMLAKPFEMALGLFVPVLSLVLSPGNSLQNESIAWKAFVFCAQGVLGALLTGAFSTLNVQQLDPVVVPTIVVSDLSSSTSVNETTVDIRADLAFALRPTEDTLLRTALMPVYVTGSESRCQGRGGWPNVATTYAFFANDWLVDLLPDGAESSFSLYANLSVASSTSGTEVGDHSSSNDGFAESEIDSFNASLSGNLLLYMVFFSQTLLAWDGLSYLENSSLAQFQEEVASWRPEASDQGTDEQVAKFQLAARTMLRNTLEEQSTRIGLHFDTSAASINVSHFALSADVDFDAVTVEIPFDEQAIASNVSGSGSKSGPASGSNAALIRNLSSVTGCGESACLIQPPGSFSATAVLGDVDYTQWNVEPQIQAFAACLFDDGTEFMPTDYLHGAGCSRRSSTSFLVYSFARRVTADSMEFDNASSDSPVVAVTGLQRYHTITLGRLSWRSKDLASVFNAACGVGDSDGSCIGLTFPLSRDNSSTVSRHLIVGEAHTPTTSLGLFDGLYSRWTPLAMVTTPTNMKGDLLFQQNVRDVDWQGLDGQCSTSVDVFASQVEQNHWYMGFGLQEAYTAALFLLFQHAVVREESTNVDGGRTLDFAGSRTSVTLQARIPLQSALISIFGCVVVLAGALCIALAGRRQESVIQRDLRAEEIAKVLLVDQRFPKIVLDCSLSDADECVPRPLHTFHIEALVLHQEESGSSDVDGSVCIRYPPGSA